MHLLVPNVKHTISRVFLGFELGPRASQNKRGAIVLKLFVNESLFSRQPYESCIEASVFMNNV